MNARKYIKIHNLKNEIDFNESELNKLNQIKIAINKRLKKKKSDLIIVCAKISITGVEFTTCDKDGHFEIMAIKYFIYSLIHNKKLIIKDLKAEFNKL